MIQVILLILKMIGITLLAILCLVLIVLALVLFVPVFYKAEIIHNPQKTQIKAGASFLFPLLSVRFEYLEKMRYAVRIFGISLLDSEKAKKDNRKKSKARKRKKKKNKSGKKPERKKKKDIKPESTEKPQNEVRPESTEKLQNEVRPESTEKPQNGVRPESAEKLQNKGKSESAEKLQNDSRPKNESTTEIKEKSKNGFFEKIKSKIKKIRDTISSIRQKIHTLLCRKDEVFRILKKPETKHALAFVWKELKQLLKHILPRKIKGYVAYGADNPETTGKVVGIISILYAKTGRLLELRPNFEEKQLEADVKLKGRIQLFMLLLIAGKVFFNKELTQAVKELKQIKETE